MVFKKNRRNIMKLNYPLVIGTLSLALIGCNTTGIDRQHPETIASATAFSNVIVYPTRADIPKNSRIIGKVTASNKLPNGLKASPDEIMVELKRKAFLNGANGIVHVTPGTAQTTANAVISY
jgi:hypothetical protein